MTDGAQTSNTASKTVDIDTPAEVSGAFVTSTSWTSTFTTYLSTSGLGSASDSALGFALQTVSSQTTVLPWTNIDTIEIQFNEPVALTANALQLVGGAGGTTPTVTGVTALGNNTYSLSLSAPLTNNSYLIAIDAAAVTDAHGAQLDGAWTTGTSTFTTGSGTGAAGSNFEFFFNILPGAVTRSNSVSLTDVNTIRSLNNTRASSPNYSAYADIFGSGAINLAEINADAGDNNQRLNAMAPIEPALAPPQSTPISGSSLSAGAPASTTTSSAGASPPSAASGGAFSAVVILAADGSEAMYLATSGGESGGGASAIAISPPSASASTTASPTNMPASDGPSIAGTNLGPSSNIATAIGAPSRPAPDFLNSEHQTNAFDALNSVPATVSATASPPSAILTAIPTDRIFASIGAAHSTDTRFDSAAGSLRLLGGIARMPQSTRRSRTLVLTRSTSRSPIAPPRIFARRRLWREGNPNYNSDADFL